MSSSSSSFNALRFVVATWLLASVVADAVSPPRHRVPLFSLAELADGRGDVDDRLREVLSTTGLLAVRVVNNEESAVDIRALCGCDLGSVANGDSAALGAGVRRTTLATATAGLDRPVALPDLGCGADAARTAEAARDVVARATGDAFLPALDRALGANYADAVLRDVDGRAYPDVASVVADESAVHPEHFHAYSRPTEHDDDDDDRALDWHADAGLFLAFLPGRSCRRNNDALDESFHVSVPGRGERVAVFPAPSSPRETVVAFMLGVGAEHWLSWNESTATPRPRATRHAVVLKPGDERVWYGMMHLVPPRAIVQTTSRQITFAEMRGLVAAHHSSRTFGDDPSSSSSEVVSVGCGVGGGPPTLAGRRRRRTSEHGVDPSACGNRADGRGDFYCWMQCSAVVDDADAPSSDDRVYCLNRHVLATTRDVSRAVEACTDARGVVGGVMDAGCSNVRTDRVEGVRTWQRVVDDQDEPNTNHNQTTNDPDKDPLYQQRYCYGATAMYMQGFEWEGTTCVVYLFKSWIVTTRAGLAFACLGTVLLGVATELLLDRRRRGLRGQSSPARRVLWSFFSYAAQLTLGYALMLVVMTYSGPLVLSVVAGLTIGHVVAHRKALLAIDDDDDGSCGPPRGLELSTDGGGGTTPCCLTPSPPTRAASTRRKETKTTTTTSATEESSGSGETADCCQCA